MLDDIKKHAKYFVNEEHNSENARGINYYEDGSLFMCDGIVGVYAYNVHTEGAKVTSVAGRNLKIEGLAQSKALALVKDISQVQDNALAICNIEVEELLNYVKTVNAIDVAPEDEDKTKPLRFEFNEKGISVKAHRFEFSSEYHDSEYSFENSYAMGLDAERLEDVLKFILDVGYDDVKMFYGGLAYPVEFRSYDGLLRVIVMQLRLY